MEYGELPAIEALGLAVIEMRQREPEPPRRPRPKKADWLGLRRFEK